MTGRPFSVATLAERWGCSKRHISNMVRRGELTAFRIGKQMRFRPGEVERVECATALQNTKEGLSRSSTREAVAAELRLRRLTSSQRQQRQQSLLVISNNESPGKD